MSQLAGKSAPTPSSLLTMIVICVQSKPCAHPATLTQRDLQRRRLAVRPGPGAGRLALRRSAAARVNRPGPGRRARTGGPRRANGGNGAGQSERVRDGAARLDGGYRNGVTRRTQTWAT
jgi:hypothetical protein